MLWSKLPLTRRLRFIRRQNCCFAPFSQWPPCWCLHLIYYLSVMKQDYTLASTFRSYVHCILAPVCLLILTAISVERLLALLLRQGYRQFVTPSLKRTAVVVFAFWVVCSIAAARTFWNYHFRLCFGNTVSSICLLTSVFCYMKIFLTLRQSGRQTQRSLRAH